LENLGYRRDQPVAFQVFGERLQDVVQFWDREARNDRLEFQGFKIAQIPACHSGRAWLGGFHFVSSFFVLFFRAVHSFYLRRISYFFLKNQSPEKIHHQKKKSHQQKKKPINKKKTTQRKKQKSGVFSARNSPTMALMDKKIVLRDFQSLGKKFRALGWDRASHPLLCFDLNLPGSSTVVYFSIETFFKNFTDVGVEVADGRLTIPFDAPKEEPDGSTTAPNLLCFYSAKAARELLPFDRISLSQKSLQQIMDELSLYLHKIDSLEPSPLWKIEKIEEIEPLRG
jgi:hypothetical protein